jgi:hypothetical protein
MKCGFSGVMTILSSELAMNGLPALGVCCSLLALLWKQGNHTVFLSVLCGYDIGALVLLHAAALNSELQTLELCLFPFCCILIYTHNGCVVQEAGQ